MPPTPPSPPEPAAEADIEVPLRWLPLWSSTLSLLAQFAVLIALSCVVEVAPRLWRHQAVQPEVLFSLSLLSACTAAMLACLGRRLWVRRRPLQPLRLTPAGLLLPRHAESHRQVLVPYGEVVSVLEGGSGRRRALVVEGGRRVFVLPQGLFVEAHGIDRLASALKQRIWAGPGGGEQVEQTRRRRHEARVRLSQRPFWSQALVGVMAVMFVSTVVKHSLEGPFDLIRWGALVPTEVAAGALWRLWAASFLHTSTLQALVCLATLYTLASLVERLMGWHRMALLVASGSAVVMAVQAVASDQVASVGASGCIFTLLGAFACISRRLRLLLPLGVLQPARWWTFIIGLHAAFTLLWPMTQLTVLVVGMAWGALVGRAMLRSTGALPTLQGRRREVAGGAALAVMALSLGAAIAHAAHAGADDDLTLGAELLRRRGSLQRLRADGLARGWLEAEVGDPRRRRCALQLARHNRAAEPSSPAYADTLAQALAREGQPHEALQQGLAAVELGAGNAPLYELSMARLLQRAGDVATRADVPADDLAAVDLALDRGSGDLVLAALPSAEAWHVFGMLHQGERTLAMAHVRAEAAAQLPSRYAPQYGWQREPASRLSFKVVWMQRGGGRGAGAPAVHWTLAPVMPQPARRGAP